MAVTKQKVSEAILGIKLILTVFVIVNNSSASGVCGDRRRLVVVCFSQDCADTGASGSANYCSLQSASEDRTEGSSTSGSYQCTPARANATIVAITAVAITAVAITAVVVPADPGNTETPLPHASPHPRIHLCAPLGVGT